MLPENFGGADRERRIEKDRRGRHIAALHQVDQIDDQFLGALDREGRNQQRAIGGVGGAHLGGQMLAPRSGVVDGRSRVAIGRFRDDIIEAGRRLGIRLQQFGVGADVAGGKHAQRLAGRASLGELDLDGGGAEQVAGVPVARADARHGIEPGLIVDRPERVERGNGVGLCVDRRDLGAPARRVAPVEGGDFGFLDAARHRAA